MGDKRKQKRTTKKTNWDNIRSWVGAVLCIAIIVVIATYVAKLVPSSSAYTPGPIGVTPIDGTPIAPIPARITFSAPIQLTGLSTNPPDFEFSTHYEYASDSDGSSVLFWYADFPSYSRRSFIYSIKNQTIEEVTLPLTYAGGRGFPRISGDKIVFAIEGNIYVYDIGTQETILITDDVSQDPCERPNDVNQNPDVDGDWVVWAHSVCVLQAISPPNIYAKNIKTGEKIQLNPSSYTQNHPRISGTKIVWQDGRHAYVPYSQERYEKCVKSGTHRDCVDVYLYDLTTRAIAQRLTTDYAAHQYPNIDKNLVVWFDDQNYNWDWSHQTNMNKRDVFVYDMRTSQVTDIVVLGSLPGYRGFNSLGLQVWEELVSYGVSINSLFTNKIFLYDTITNEQYDIGRGFILPGNNYPTPVVGGVYPYFHIVWTQDGEYGISSDDLYMIQARMLT